MAITWDAQRYAASLRHDDARIVRAAASGLDVRVPSCPEWTMSDLVWHVGWVHSFWGQIVARRLTQPSDVVMPERPEDEKLVDWFGELSGDTADVLEHADPADEVFTWAAQKDVAFVQRRMAQEVTVHAWDAVGAAGDPEPVDADLAVDGIDEYIELFMPVWVRQPVDPGPYSVALSGRRIAGVLVARGARGAAPRRAGARRRVASATVRPARRLIARTIIN